MSSIEEWNIEEHKLEHECDEHWELRRKFLLVHRDKFPEDELICLAQVFINVEFLGCRYPQETMQLVAELSEDVVKEHREKQKTKLQRTFVKASDAASAKVKGLNESSRNNISGTNSQVTNKRSFPSPLMNKSIDKRIKLSAQPFGNIVLVEHPDDAPPSIIAYAVNASGASLEWKFERSEGRSICNVFINSNKLADGCGSNQKMAKKEAATAALCELRKYYYSIKVKKIVHQEPEMISGQMLRKVTPPQDSLADDNIGKKLMKLMGWAGGGLGKTQQGIAEPVTVQQQMSREGFGLKVGTSDSNVLRKKCQDVLRKYARSDMRSDLVFSTDFTNEERALIHQVARQMGLKSHSYGPKGQRTLIISRKVDPWELVTELKELGGHTKKYELIEPTGL